MFGHRLAVDKYFPKVKYAMLLFPSNLPLAAWLALVMCCITLGIWIR